MKTFKNPVIPGFHPDPSICRAGDDFYLVNSTFEYFPGLPIYHSRDLVNWRLIGNALNRPSQLNLKGATDTGGLYAPTIRHWEGLFYLNCSNMTQGGSFIVTAKDPAGPWSEPMWMGDGDMDGSMFFDDDGKAYYTKHSGGERGGIAQAQFDPRTGKLTTPLKVIYNDVGEPWNEGPHLYKIRGWYYLMLAQGGTGDRHQEVIGRSKSPWGPFAPSPANPILTHRDFPESPIQCTGHADMVEAPDGSWWTVFLAVRPQDGISVLGRETFLAPVAWNKDGWPVVGDKHHVALEMAAPNLEPHPFPAPPARQNFDSAKLGPEWIHVRNPNPAHFSLDARKGSLRIMAAAGSLNSRDDVPAFAGQRQPDFRARFRTEMEFAPGKDGEEAGLSVRTNEGNHYEIGVERFEGKRRVFVRNTVRGVAGTVAQASLKGAKLQLEITAIESQFQFAWSADGKSWTHLAASPAAGLSKDRNSGFTGTVVGLYASANGGKSEAYADFNWFEVQQGTEAQAMPLSKVLKPVLEPLATWRIRPGGGYFTDHLGRIWSADRGFEGGDTFGTSAAIEGAKDPALYQTERWGREFSYAFPVQPGSYQVTLRFAESYVQGPGQRIFSLDINGRQALKDFDIYKESGGFNKAIDKRFEGVVPDAEGRIVLRFAGSIQNAKVGAIEIAGEK